jgi:uncharacterized protein
MARHRGPLFRLFRIVLLMAVVLSASSLAYIWHIGAWNLIFPSTRHDTVAPQISTGLGSPAVLVFSKTNSFRHKEGIAGGGEVLRDIVARRGWHLFHTENGAVFNAQDLSRFAAVVFLNASGDMLSTSQERDFQQWLEAGGGWLGIHSAGDSSHLGWQWYMDNFIGARFTAHILDPQFQRATVVLENHGHPVLRGIPNIWEHEEEWYSWESSPRDKGFTILATLDEDSYTPVQKLAGRERDLRMGDHPIVWSRCVGAGRSVYMAMGHRADAFEQPQVRLLMENALGWFINPGDDDEACPRVH